MKLLRYLLIAFLVFGVALVGPARTQTAPLRLPRALNATLCLNQWDRASSLVQQLLDSPTLAAGDRSQLAVLSAQIKNYQTTKASVDQSDACARALLPAQGTRNRTAVRRQNRSIEEGDHRPENGEK